MSLQHSPDGPTSKAVLQVCAEAIRALEKVTGSFKEHDITREDDEAFTTAKRRLRGILEANGYTIDVDTNRLKRREE